MAKRMTIAERIAGKSQFDPFTGCVNWLAAKDDCGYGRLLVNKIARKAHRVSYEDAFGSIPEGKCVCHKCDNPSCVNPNHLFLGTHSENMADMAAKGRRLHQTAGEKNPRAKLTAEQARAIRMATCSLSESARRYGVSVTVVSHIVRGKLWRGV